MRPDTRAGRTPCCLTPEASIVAARAAQRSSPISIGGADTAGWTPVASANSRKLSQFPEPIAGVAGRCLHPARYFAGTCAVPARLRLSISSRPAVADVRRQWGMEDLGGLEI